MHNLSIKDVEVFNIYVLEVFEIKTGSHLDGVVCLMKKIMETGCGKEWFEQKTKKGEKDVQ